MQKDNTTLERKTALRLSLRRQLQDPPVVIETHGGLGKVWEANYSDCPRGAVFEVDAAKADVLAWQRPSWSVYESPAETALAAGAASHLTADLVDVDPYGDPWPTLEAFFGSARPFAPVLGVAVNDGLRQGLKMGRGWGIASMREALTHFGNARLYGCYLEVVRWNLARLTARCGYRCTHWTGYYCGHAGQMTHYAAVLERV